MKRVYFDHNATTPMHPEVARAVSAYLCELYGNPSSIHWAGREVRSYYGSAKEQVARLISAEPDEIVFTSCGTESDNHAIKGVAYAKRDRGRHIITTNVEHPAVARDCRRPQVGSSEIDPNGVVRHTQGES